MAIDDQGIQEIFPENVLSETKNLKFDWSDNRKDLTFFTFYNY